MIPIFLHSVVTTDGIVISRDFLVWAYSSLPPLHWKKLYDNFSLQKWRARTCKDHTMIWKDKRHLPKLLFQRRPFQFVLIIRGVFFQIVNKSFLEKCTWLPFKTPGYLDKGKLQERCGMGSGGWKTPPWSERMVFYGKMGMIFQLYSYGFVVVVVVVAAAAAAVVPKIHDSHSTTLVRDLLAKDTWYLYLFLPSGAFSCSSPMVEVLCRVWRWGIGRCPSPGVKAKLGIPRFRLRILQGNCPLDDNQTHPVVQLVILEFLPPGSKMRAS